MTNQQDNIIFKRLWIEKKAKLKKKQNEVSRKKIKQALVYLKFYISLSALLW